MQNGSCFIRAYSIGGYVLSNSGKETWGTGAIEEISARLHGYSPTSIKLMRRFFEAWNPVLQY